MYIECLPERMSVHRVHVVPKGRQILLGLESQPNVRGHVGARTWTLSLDGQPVFSTAELSLHQPHFILALKKKIETGFLYVRLAGPEFKLFCVEQEDLRLIETGLLWLQSAGIKGMRHHPQLYYF